MRELVVQPLKAGVIYKEIAFDSNETLPTADIAEGSLAVATDTGGIYLFNETSGDWVLQFSLQD